MTKLAIADDDLEDDGPDPYNVPTRDLTWPVRKLAAAVLVRAVLDSKLPGTFYRQDAAEFLYPSSEPAREHLRRVAELAGLSPAWLNECLAKSAGMPLPTIRKCMKCKSTLPSDCLAPRFDGDPGRYCGSCREEVMPVCPNRRRFGKRSASGRRPGAFRREA